MTVSPLGYAHLTVTDLDRSLAFYQQALGLQIYTRESHSVTLGTGESILLVLTENPQAMNPGRSTGLYHFALKLPTRLELARFVQHLIDQQIPIQGVADHGVSEAIYLPDPDGNGIEVYHDRPEKEWYGPSGDLILTTEPLNLDNLLAQLPYDANGWHSLPAGTVLGHIHLHVADLDTTSHFYRDILGMDLVAEYGGSALFFSWDGYHHHVGANTWNGRGAPAPPAEATGLRYFTLQLNAARFQEILGRLKTHNVQIDEAHGGKVVRDPSGNGLVLIQALEKEKPTG